MTNPDNPPAATLSDESDSLVFAILLDGKGGAAEIGAAEAQQAWQDNDRALWLHVNGSSGEVRRWIEQDSGLTQPTSGALLSRESRPRYFHGAAGSVIILRGINLNEGSSPEDMVALRIWCDGLRLVTLREEKLRSVREVRDVLVELKRGPGTIAALFLALIDQLVGKIGEVVRSYDDQLDGIEADLEDERASELRTRLSDMRSEMVGLRRYLAPQRDALNMLLADPPQWLDHQDGLVVRELIDRSQRQWEEIDAARERAMVLKDEIANRLSERLNKNMYVLSIVAAIFLPLGFLTGLLGINVGGMPGVDDDMAFWLTVAGLAVVTTLQLLLFRALKWL